MHVRFGEERQGNSSTTLCLLLHSPPSKAGLFLAVVIDLFSRRVVGWSMRPDMAAQPGIDALEMGWLQRRPTSAGIDLPFDRGSQYASHEFPPVASRSTACRASMSRKGNCWDNAP